MHHFSDASLQHSVWDRHTESVSEQCEIWLKWSNVLSYFEMIWDSYFRHSQTFHDLSWCTLISEENIIKGDTIFANGKRVLLFTTNDLLEVLARGKEILGAGTFKITPLLWGQVFVISAQVTPFVFVPVAVFLLPDKTSQHPEAFSLLREDWASPLSGSRSPASRLTTQGRRTLPSEVSAGLSVP